MTCQVAYVKAVQIRYEDEFHLHRAELDHVCILTGNIFYDTISCVETGELSMSEPWAYRMSAQFSIG
jgi:hypothetical protein